MFNYIFIIRSLASLVLHRCHRLIHSLTKSLAVSAISPLFDDRLRTLVDVFCHLEFDKKSLGIISLAAKNLLEREATL